MKVPGVLYLVPTPLGELLCAETLPMPVISTVAALDYLVAENPKSARAFLKAVDALVPLKRLLQDIEVVRLDVSTSPETLPLLLAPICDGRDGALLSEAGCPAVADPGALLVRLAHQSGVRVRPLVGPSSILLALMASGLEGQRFRFNGYLPVEAGARAASLKALEKDSATNSCTQIFIETPYRNGPLLETCIKVLRPDTMLCVATDLTLATETIVSQFVLRWRDAPRPELKSRPSIFLTLAK